MPMNNVASARARAERWMTSTCTVTEPAVVSFDVDLGHSAKVPGDEVYDGPCRVAPTGSERPVRVGDGVVTLRTYNVDVPVGDELFSKNQVVAVTDDNDPYVAGREMRVEDVQGMTDGVYRRLVCEDTLNADEGGS